MLVKPDIDIKVVSLCLGLYLDLAELHHQARDNEVEKY